MANYTGRAHLDGGEASWNKEGIVSVVAGLSRTVEKYPKAGIRYVGDSGSYESYGEFLRRSRHIAAGLRQQGIGVEDIILLQCEEPKDMLAAFFGCMLLGAIAVPLATPPIYAEGYNTLRRLRHAWESLGKPVVLGAGRAGQF